MKDEISLMPGMCAKMEFEYIRHGTTSLIGLFNVATGTMYAPYLNQTRKEEDICKAISNAITTAPLDSWVFICDGLNTHKSESLVRLVAEECNIDIDLGIKGKSGILKNMETRTNFLHDLSH